MAKLLHKGQATIIFLLLNLTVTFHDIMYKLITKIFILHRRVI